MRPVLDWPHTKTWCYLCVSTWISLSGGWFPKVLELVRKGCGSLLKIWPRGAYGLKLNGTFCQSVPQVLKKVYHSFVTSGDRSMAPPAPTSCHNNRAANQPQSKIESSKMTCHLSVAKAIAPSKSFPPRSWTRPKSFPDIATEVCKVKDDVLEIPQRPPRSRY